MLLILLFFISYNTFGQYKLGNLISYNNHPNSLGFEISMKEPLGLEKTQINSSDMIASYAKKGIAAVQLYIVNSPRYLSREEANAMLNNDAFINVFKKTNKLNITKTELDTIDNYPALKLYSNITLDGISQRLIGWIVLYGDKTITLHCSAEKNKFDELHSFFKEIKNSISFNSSFK